MVEINFDVYTDTTASSFVVYRAMCGISFTIDNLIVGDVLRFAATSQTIQEITLADVDDIDSIISQLSDALGVTVTKSDDGNSIFFRCSASEKAKLKLYDCTFLEHIGEEPRTIIPELEFNPVTTITFIPDIFSYAYTDVDGAFLDSYRVTSVVSGVESLPSVTHQPQLGTNTLCAISGRVSDSANRPIKAAKVLAQIRVPSSSFGMQYIDNASFETITDDYGRFILYLMKTELYLLQIEAIGYNETIKVPTFPAVDLLDLEPTQDGRFSPDEDPS